MVVYLDLWFSTLVNDLERPVFHVCLHRGIVETTPDQTFGVEHCVGGVHCDLQHITLYSHGQIRTLIYFTWGFLTKGRIAYLFFIRNILMIKLSMNWEQVNRVIMPVITRNTNSLFSNYYSWPL